nr:C-type lectin 1-like [Misgurnus anguillicaudatus]
MQIDYIMERSIHLLLFSGLCLFTQTISCHYGYIMIQQMKIWDEAQAYCRQNHIDLAIVENDEDWTQTQTESNRFVLINIVTTWRQAQIYCRQQYTDLATIRTQAENNLLAQIISSPTSAYSLAWIGLFRDSWKWSDGSNVSTSSINWKSGYPAITGMKPPCGAADSNGLIVDQLCATTSPFICMQTESRKEIMRVEVQSGNNLKDSAVLESILQLVSKGDQGY